MDFDKDIPVAIVTYKRPQHTRQVIEGLRSLGVTTVYAFSDGPKSEEDIRDIKATREILHSIDWTSPEIIERKENIGLASSVVSAVDEVLSIHDRLILLEDDCVPQLYFMRYMTDCFKRYETNPRIFGISGCTLPIVDPAWSDYPYDVYFVPRIASWGWGTWKDRWQLLERDMQTALEKCEQRNIDIFQGGSDVPLMIRNLLSGESADVWTLHWVITTYLHRGFYVYPCESHIINIGMDGSGVHCDPGTHYRFAAASKPATSFPDEIILDKRIFQAYRKQYDISEAPSPEVAFEHLLHSLESEKKRKTHAGSELLL